MTTLPEKLSGIMFNSERVSETFLFQTEFGTLMSVTTCLRMKFFDTSPKTMATEIPYQHWHLPCEASASRFPVGMKSVLERNEWLRFVQALRLCGSQSPTGGFHSTIQFIQSKNTCLQVEITYRYHHSLYIILNNGVQENFSSRHT